MNLLKKLSTGAVVAVRRLCAAIAASLLLLSGFNEAVIAQADADPFDAEKFMAAIEVQGAELKARSPAAQLYRIVFIATGNRDDRRLPFTRASRASQRATWSNS